MKNFTSVTGIKPAIWRILACFMLVTLLNTFVTSAQVAAWQLNGALGSETSINASTLNANLNTSTLVRNGAVTASALANTFSSSNYPATGTKADAVNNNRGQSFTINAKTNFTVSLSTLDVRFRRSSTGPNAFAWSWSIDGTNFTQIGGDISYTGTTTGGDAQTQLNLSGITQLQNVPSSTTITFRLNGWGASATGGTFAIGRSLTNGATDFSLAIGGLVNAAGIAPSVVTTTASGITTTDALSGGNVTSDGGLSVTARGVAYGTAASPTIAGPKTTDGTGTGTFTSTISSLSVNNQYFYRAYATNSIGTAYGSESNFYTLANTPAAPVVNGATTTTLNVTVSANGNPAATQFAIQEMGTGNYVQADGSLGATQVWQTAATWGTKTITGLASNTSYTFQVKARNGSNVETAFSPTAGGTTLTASSPILSSSTLTAFGAVCLNTTAGPNTFTINGTDLSNANVTVGPLSGYAFSKDGSTYTSSLTYVQAGGSFSATVFVTFTPTAVQSYNGNIPVAGGGSASADVAASGSGINTLASVTTGGSSSITQVSATLNGTITANGCSTVSAYGIEYSTTNNFVNGTGIPAAGGALNVNTYSANISGLDANTTYYYKAYATNDGGTAYGSQQSFTTSGLDAPVATAATGNTSTSFVANWNSVPGAVSYRLDVSTSSNFTNPNATVFAGWSFPLSGTTVTPDVTNPNNTAKTLTTTGGTITDATGFTTRAPSANAWQSGAGTKYWQVDLDATGLYDLNISSKQLSSNTGPKDFKLQYRVGAGSFIDVPTGNITVLNDSWVSGTVTNLALPAACDNQPVLSIRWLMTSNISANNAAVASGGTSRIDNIQLKGKVPLFVTGYNNLTVNGLSQSVTGLSSGTTYYYRVRAFSNNSTSANSNIITTATCSSITASAGANGTISPNGVTDVCAGGSQLYTITPNMCYSIADVLVDGISQGAVSSYNFTGIVANHTISATFVMSSYAITVAAGANGSITPATGNVNCGDNASYTITADPCYSITDVVVDGVSQGAIFSYTFTNVTATHTISASFVQNTFTITVSAGANGSVTPATGAVNCGANATYSISPDPGFTIADVVVDGVSQGTVASYMFTNVQAAHMISATFVATSTFSITATAGANGSVSPNSTTTVASGGGQTYTITPDACYSIADVLVDGISQGPISSYTFSNVLANHTISASFVLNTFSITVSPGANGSVNPGTGNVSCGSNATYTITANACYSIADVVVDGASQGAIAFYTFTNVQAAHTISASFVLNTYTITVTAGVNGSVTPGTGSVNCGSNATYTITANPGYSIANVLVDGISQGAIVSYTFTNVTASHTLSASFVANTPILSSSTLTAFGAVCLNTTAGPNTFTINGTDLSNANVTVGPLSGYAFSKDGSTYTSSLTYVQAGGSFSATVFVTFTPTAVQSYNGNIPVAGGGSASADVAASGSGINTLASVTTGGSSSITQVSATLNGTITANGCSTVSAYGIEYSTTNNFVNGTGIPAAGGALNVNTYSANISGLDANTTYYYKAYATNDGGTAYGSQQSFTTSGLDAPVATAATGNTSTSFVANWNSVPGAVSYRLDVSTSSNFVSPAATTLAGWSFPVSGTTVTPDVASPNNSTKTLTTTASGGISSTAGATTQAATVNTSPAWQSGAGTKYWQVDVNTTGFYNIKLSSKQRSSGTGPRDFKLQYRVAAGTWFDVTGGTIVNADNFTSGVLSNLALPAACDNQSSISLRWIMTTNTSVNNATVAATGSSRIDDIIVAGSTALFVSGYNDLTVNGFSQVVTGLTSATSYYYRVRAVSMNSTSANSNTITTTTCAVINASAGANGSISPDGAIDVCQGESQTYTITPAACYAIADVLVDGTSVGAVGTYTFTNVTANHTISATFVQTTYTITATSGANGSVTPAGASTVNCGDNATYTITPAACYAIADVLVDGTSVGAVGTYTFTNVTANHTISATFVQTTYTITATSGANGTVTPAGASTVNCGDNATYTITPAACYAIADVLVDGTSVGAVGTYTFTNVTANHTISASFVQTTYTITATSGANGSVTPAGASTVNCGDNATYTITPAACYAIADVLVDGTSVGAVGTYTFTNVTANHTISASFVQTTYTITATSGANGSVTPAGASPVNCGANATYTITPAACYAIADVLVDGTSVGAVGTYTFTNVTANHTISATFVQTTYTITATSGANGTVTPAGASTVNCGANATYTITPNAGYAISNVIVDGASVGAVGTYTFTNVTANHTISATFVATGGGFTITSGAGANGTISPNGVTSVPSGGSQSYTMTPAACYHVQNVLVDGTSVGAVSSYTFTNVTANHTISVSFAINAPLTVSVSGPVNVCPYVGTGEQVTYTATSAGATGFTWVTPPNVNIVSGQGTANLVVTFGAGFTAAQPNKQLKVTALSPCGNSTQFIYYLAVQTPTTPQPIVAGSSDVCAVIGTAGTITYTIPSVSGASSYNWSAQAGTTTITHPNGLGVNDTTVNVSFTNGFSSSNITVSATSPCATSGTRSLLINRNSPSTPGLISGPTNACEYIAPNGTPATYSVNAVATATSYTWTYPAGAIGVTGQGTNSISFTYPAGFTSGTVTVTATNGCGTSGVRSLTITKLNPATPSVIDVIQTSPCPNRVYTYTLSAMPSNATSVLWTVPAGGTIISGQGTTSITVSYAATAIQGNVTAQGVSNCGTSATRISAVKLAACPAGGRPVFTKTAAEPQLLTVAGMEVSVFPNPTTTDFKLQVITAGKEAINVRILDLQGRSLKAMTVQPHTTVNIGSDLKAGAYMIEVRQGQEIKTTRVLKF